MGDCVTRTPLVAITPTKAMRKVSGLRHAPRARERRSEALGNISFEGPIGPENTSEGGGVPLEIGQIRVFIHP